MFPLMTTQTLYDVTTQTLYNVIKQTLYVENPWTKVFLMQDFLNFIIISFGENIQEWYLTITSVYFFAG